MSGIFIIGGTGHIGGAVLDRIFQVHPELLVKALVRTEEKASRLVSKYPKVHPVIGDLSSLSEIEAGCREAAIVVNTAPDVTHDDAHRAIKRGMSNREAKGYYIHTSGASLIWDEPNGSKDARVWDDITDIKELASMDVKYTHSATDKFHVAIISPGFVGGLSPSLEHPTPITTPGILLTARAFKSGFQIAEGQNRHAWIHILDLAVMYLTLVGKALNGITNENGLDLWEPEAYYFGCGEEISFTDFIAGLAPVLKKHGVIQSTEVKSVSVTEAARASIGGENYDADAPPPPQDSWAMHIAIMYGINMQIRASRMQKLGWKPEKAPVVDTFEGVIGAYLALKKAQLK